MTYVAEKHVAAGFLQDLFFPFVRADDRAGLVCGSERLNDDGERVRETCAYYSQFAKRVPVFLTAQSRSRFSMPHRYRTLVALGDIRQPPAGVVYNADGRHGEIGEQVCGDAPP